MTTFYIKDSNQANQFMAYGPTLSFSLSRQNLTNSSGSVVIDNSTADKAIVSGVFAFNNNRPISAKTTSSLSTVSSNFLLNMANNRKINQYPKQESFGDPKNTKLIRGFLNNYVFFAPVNPTVYNMSSLGITFYFYSESSTDWSDINNWWTDENFTIQATKLPSDIDIINIVSPIEVPDTIKIISTNPISINNPLIEINDANESSPIVIQSGLNISLSNNYMIFDDTIISNAQIPPRNFIHSTKLFENNDFIIYRLENTLPFDGEFQLSFISDSINPENNPMVIHITYDEETEQNIYEDITTSVSEGSILANTSSFSDFIIIKNTVGTLDINGQMSGGFDPCLVLTGCTAPNNYNDNNCGFNIDNWFSINCPGNQTRGSLIGGGSCGCYESSFVTVEMIASLVSLVGIAKAGLCAVAGQIRSRRVAIEILQNDYNWLQLEALNLKKPIQVLGDMIQDLSDMMFDSRITVYQGPDIIEYSGYFTDLEFRGKPIRDVILKLQAKARNLEARRLNLRWDLQALDRSMLKLTQEIGALLSKRANDLATLFTNLFILYTYMNNISNPKECPEGQILDPLTCECLPCSVINYCGQCDENGDSQEDRTGIVATWTVTIPNEYTLPLQITFSGGVNDQLIVNGDVVGESDFTYVYTATQRSFVMSINNTGAGANATFQICPQLEIGSVDTGL
jgi:hypothetical protein